MIDTQAQLFGLPGSLLIPIAARSIDAIEQYVGLIQHRITGRSGRINAVAVVPHSRPNRGVHDAPLWEHKNSSFFKMRLHPVKQVWVHVDFNGYRKAYERLGMPTIPRDHVLDHIQNREAIRLHDYSHPYIRLCPVSRAVNTSAGHDSGGEGMEKEHLRSLDAQPDSVQAAVEGVTKCDVIYADPMDLTKMLNIQTGTFILNGVRDMLHLFYPK